MIAVFDVPDIHSVDLQFDKNPRRGYKESSHTGSSRRITITVEGGVLIIDVSEEEATDA